ncbi:purine permease, partial [Escherichia coli]
DRNRSHWSTSKTPSYTKSVSWQHHRAVVLNVFFNGYQHHADLVKESVSDKDLKVRTVRMWLLMRKLKKNEHGE